MKRLEKVLFSGADTRRGVVQLHHCKGTRETASQDGKNWRLFRSVLQEYVRSKAQGDVAVTRLGNPKDAESSGCSQRDIAYRTECLTMHS